MTIHKEGYTSIAITLLFIFVINAFIDYRYADITWLRWLVYILSFALFITVLQFFRNPKRAFAFDDTALICPADGKVVVIEETEEAVQMSDYAQTMLDLSDKIIYGDLLRFYTPDGFKTVDRSIYNYKIDQNASNDSNTPETTETE